MSAWGEMRHRSAGKLTRKEDVHEYITLDKIEEMLKSMRVGQNQGEYAPIYAFSITVKDLFSDVCTVYSITAVATTHQDGTRNFYSNAVLNSFENLMKKGDIIKIENLFL